MLFKEVDIAQGLTAAAANIINEYQATSLVSRVPPFFQPVKNYHKLQLTIKAIKSIVFINGQYVRKANKLWLEKNCIRSEKGRHGLYDY